tara:strand:+ start:2203 stop:2565 length:363 start_codon:yes stop_codon:yes gene_type:complete
MIPLRINNALARFRKILIDGGLDPKMAQPFRDGVVLNVPTGLLIYLDIPGIGSTKALIALGEYGKMNSIDALVWGEKTPAPVAHTWANWDSIWTDATDGVEKKFTTNLSDGGFGGSSGDW